MMRAPKSEVTSFTSKMRRLRHVYSMLENLNKQNVEPSPTLHNMLLDIWFLTAKLLQKAEPPEK